MQDSNIRIAILTCPVTERSYVSEHVRLPFSHFKNFKEQSSILKNWFDEAQQTNRVLNEWMAEFTKYVTYMLYIYIYIYSMFTNLHLLKHPFIQPWPILFIYINMLVLQTLRINLMRVCSCYLMFYTFIIPSFLCNDHSIILFSYTF